MLCDIILPCGILKKIPTLSVTLVVLINTTLVIQCMWCRSSTTRPTTRPVRAAQHVLCVSKAIERMLGACSGLLRCLFPTQTRTHFTLMILLRITLNPLCQLCIQQLDSFSSSPVVQSGQFCQFCRNPSALTTSVRLKRGKSQSLSYLLVLHYNYKLKSQIQRIYAVQIKMPGCPSSWLANRASGTLSGHHHLSLRRCWSLNIVDTKHPPHSCQFIVKPSSCDIAGNHLICPPIASEP